MDTVDSINQEYSARCKGMLSIDLKSISKRAPYAYQATLRRDRIAIEATTPLSAAHGISRVGTGILSGHFPEYLGTALPEFSLRPLWLQGGQSLPEDWESRLIKLGFNALITSHKVETSSLLTVFTTEESLLHNSQVHGLLYISQINQQEFLEGKEDYTLFDVLKMELQRIEQQMPKGKKLLFFVPSNQSDLLLKLSLYQKKNTLLLFGSQNEQSHQLWKTLRSHREVIETPIMPVGNFGGNDKWPTLPIDNYTQLIQCMLRHHFLGTVAIASAIPEIESLAGLRLWLAAEMQWDRRSLINLFETWVKAYQPNWNSDSLFPLFERASYISKNILTMKGSPNQNHLFLETKALLENLEYSLDGREGAEVSLFRSFIKEEAHFFGILR